MRRLEEHEIKELVERALEQRKYSHAPYSGFRVGAALLTKDKKIYGGCNIENAAYSPGICAERTAIFKAVSEGNRKFDAICIVGGREEKPIEFAAPCGVCRQVMMEFCEPDFTIILATDTEHYQCFTLGELFPMGFGPENL